MWLKKIKFELNFDKKRNTLKSLKKWGKVKKLKSENF